MCARLCVALLACCAFAACPGKPQPDAGVAAIDLTRSTLTLSQTAGVVADGNAQVDLTATLRDTNGAPVQGTLVTFAMTGTGNIVPPSPQAGTTDQSGEARSFVKSTHAEQKLVTASVEVEGAQVELPAVSVTFVAGPAQDFAFVTQPSTTKAGVVMTPPVRLTVTDNHGNVATEPLAITLRLVRSNSGTLTGGGPLMSVDGGVSFEGLTINRPQVGRALRAEAANGAAAESDLFDVTLGDLAAATSTFVAAPANALADGVSAVTLTLTTRDTGGNALAAQPVSLTATGTGHALGASTGTTDATGVFTTTLTSTVAQAKTVTATVNGLTFDVGVTFIP